MIRHADRRVREAGGTIEVHELREPRDLTTLGERTRITGRATAHARFSEYANPLYRMPMTFAEIFPVGVLVSLVSAALPRNSRFLAAARA